MIHLEKYAPVAVGGIGGSGTRLLARLLIEMGYYMGSDLNFAKDNLWYSFLFVRANSLEITDNELKKLLEIFITAMVERKRIPPADKKRIDALASLPGPHEVLAQKRWARTRTRRLKMAVYQNYFRKKVYWGWKEPNTHILLDRLITTLPKMKYIHVARNGLDMAYSQNQRQPKLWGPIVFGMPPAENIDPEYSLTYWRLTHQRIFAVSARMESRFFFLNFDRLCQNPREQLSDLCHFLNMNINHNQFDSLIDLIDIPVSIGRFKNQGLARFDPDDVAFVASLGFDTSLK